MTNLTPALSSPVMPGFIYRLGTERQAAWRHHPHSPPPLRAESLSPCTRAYQAQPRGDSVTPPPRHSHHLPLQPCSCLPLSLPCRAEPGVLSVPDSYQVTLKHKRVEEEQAERQTEGGWKHKQSGWWWILAFIICNHVVHLHIAASPLLPFKIHQRRKEIKGGEGRIKTWSWCPRNKIIWLHEFSFR